MLKKILNPKVMKHTEITNDVPIFKIDYGMKLIYFNLRAKPLLSYWKCLERNKVPGKLIGEHQEIFNKSSRKDYFELDLNFNHEPVHFTVIPFPEAGYIGFYGDFVSQKQTA